MKKKTIALVAIIGLALNIKVSQAQVGESNSKLIQESTEVLSEMVHKNPSLKSYYDESYGYAIFPKVTKAAATVGGALGRGIVYKNHLAMSTSNLKQLTVGFQ